jgi:hypothetical protein
MMKGSWLRHEQYCGAIHNDHGQRGGYQHQDLALNAKKMPDKSADIKNVTPALLSRRV